MLQNLRTVITSVLSHLEIKEEKDQNVDSKNNGNYIKSDTKNKNWGLKLTIFAQVLRN